MALGKHTPVAGGVGEEDAIHAEEEFITHLFRSGVIIFDHV